ncbi:hypothetical protein STANM309S_04710 [Streptomyces tanashiensis]
MPLLIVTQARESSGTTARTKETQMRLVATRSLAWRLPSTLVVTAKVTRTKSRAAIRPHWTLLCQPAARPMPMPPAMEPAAMAAGVQRGSRAWERDPRRGATETGRSCMAWLMPRPPSTPCGGR